MILTGLKSGLVVLALIIVTCLVSTMAVFMGGGQGGTDLHSLMVMQAASIPIAILSVVAILVPAGDGGNGARRIWAAIPQWMVFGFLLLNSLVIAGETAFLIVLNATERDIVWTEHIPLAAMLACSVAFCVLYARLNVLTGNPKAMSGRWTR